MIPSQALLRIHQTCEFELFQKNAQPFVNFLVMKELEIPKHINKAGHFVASNVPLFHKAAIFYMGFCLIWTEWLSLRPENSEFLSKNPCKPCPQNGEDGFDQAEKL